MQNTFICYMFDRTKYNIIFKLILISSVKQLIMINRIQNNEYLFCYIYTEYLYWYLNMHLT